MSGRRISTAASVLAQAKARAAAPPKNVIPLAPEAARSDGGDTASVLHARVEETADFETGARRLLVIIPGRKMPEIYDLSRLLVQPEVARFFAEGFRQWAAGPVTAQTRVNRCRLLNNYFGAFLATLKGQVSLNVVDEAFWTSLIAWLNGPRRRNGQPWAPSTRAQVHSAVRICIDALEGHSEHGAVAIYLFERSGFPHNPWPGIATKNVPTPVLSPPERRAMILASLGEISTLRERLEEREAILATGRAMLYDARAQGHKPAYRSEIGVCAARIAEAFPDRLASLKDLFSLDWSLGRAVQDKHGMQPVRRLLYASFRDLVPIVLLIGIKTAFNPDTLLSLAWSRVRISEDKTTITIIGVKSRAADLQTSITPDDGTNEQDAPAEPDVPFALAELLALLRRLTERSRAILANKEHADRLFIGVPVASALEAKAFEHVAGASSDICWKRSLENFIKDHDLKPFTLQMLRFTEAEQEWRRTGDTLAVRDRLGQKHASTTRNHYTSDVMRRESQERVAETQTLYHRWAETEGRSDPRHQPERCRSG